MKVIFQIKLLSFIADELKVMVDELKGNKLKIENDLDKIKGNFLCNQNLSKINYKRFIR